MENYLPNEQGFFSFLDPFFYIFGRFVKTKCRTFLRMAQKSERKFAFYSNEKKNHYYTNNNFLAELIFDVRTEIWR